MYKLITFDINGTLLKTKIPVGVTYTEIGKKYGIVGITPEKLEENFKKQWKRMLSIHPNFGLKSIGYERWWDNMVASTFINSTRDVLDDESLKKISSYLIQHYSSGSAWDFTEGAVDLLSSLKSSDNIVVGAISNFDSRLNQILIDLQMPQYFSFVLTSYETTFFKPDINIFKLAESKYEEKTGKKLIGAQALHVGNSFEEDVLGARDAGWRAAYVSRRWNLLRIETKENMLAFKDLKTLKDHLLSKKADSPENAGKAKNATKQVDKPVDKQVDKQVDAPVTKKN